MTSPLPKKQRTSEVSEQQQQQQISQEDQVPEQQQYQVTNVEEHDMDLSCYEEDMQHELVSAADIDLACYEEDMQHELAAADIKGQDLVAADMDLYEKVDEYISILLTKQLTAIDIKKVNQDIRLKSIETMLSSENAIQYPNAIHLAVDIFDRYFESFPRNGEPAINPETVVSVALFIAVKYVYGITKPLTLQFSPRNVHYKKSLVDIELAILRAVDFNLYHPMTKTFVDLYLTKNKTDTSIKKELLSYLTDLSLLDIHCSEFLPSHMAAACIFLATFVHNPMICPEVELPFDFSGHLKRPVLILHDLYTKKGLPSVPSIPDEYFG